MQETKLEKFKFSLKTMGCKANVYDSLVIEQDLMAIGGERFHTDGSQSGPDIFVLNSCTVTDQADRQAYKEIDQAKKLGAITVLTGCLASVNPQTESQSSESDLNITNADKHTLQQKVAKALGRELSASGGSVNDIYWGQLPLSSDKTRSFLKIQEGCNDYCTYCIIPYARGKSRSIPQSMLINEIKRLVDHGITEVVLTGTNIADYGIEYGQTLTSFIEAILTETSLPRLRLSSLDPTEISEQMLDLMKSGSRLMPHFHVSLQHSDSRILRLMKRHYRREDVVECLEKIHSTRKDIFVGMDLIAGFPGETEEDHVNQINLLKSLAWSRLHVFPYSERAGTPALKLKDSVPWPVRKNRTKELNQLSHERHAEFLKPYLHNTTEGILLESSYQNGTEPVIVGHLANYIRVMCPVPQNLLGADLRNTIARARIYAMEPKPAQDWTLLGHLIVD